MGDGEGVCGTHRSDALRIEWHHHATSQLLGRHKYAVSAVEWYPHDTGMCFTASFDRTINVVDTNRTTVREAARVVLLAPRARAHHPFSGALLTRHRQSIFVFPFKHRICHIAAQPSSRCLIAAALDGPELRLCDLKSGSATHSLSRT